ncbi:uncharacterized protein V2V93DRAFT_371689 [Kockiozyma suomiensis]|uniref:uncharacterized protein n=1 Tax=Kockiozyma suomiensis TaxID=1337062 RepID=UPI003343347B
MFTAYPQQHPGLQYQYQSPFQQQYQQQQSMVSIPDYSVSSALSASAPEYLQPGRFFTEEQPSILRQPYAFANISQLQEMLLPLYQSLSNSLPTVELIQSALPRLVFLSRYLAEHAEDLGLVDDTTLTHESRLRFWALFNHTWLALLSRALSSAADVSAQITLLSPTQLDECAAEIVDLSDALQRYGLVDYEIGVWEDRLIECMI